MSTTLEAPTHPTVGSLTLIRDYGAAEWMHEPASPALRRHGWRIHRVYVTRSSLGLLYRGCVHAFRLIPDPGSPNHAPYTDRVEALLKAQAKRTIRAAYADADVWGDGYTPRLRFDLELSAGQARLYFEEV